MIDLLTDEKNTRLVSFEGKALSDITFLFDALLVQFSDSHKFSTYLADSYMVLLLNTIRLALTKQEQISEKKRNLFGTSSLISIRMLYMHRLWMIWQKSFMYPNTICRIASKNIRRRPFTSIY